MIEIKNLSRGYGSSRGITDINLTIKPNEVCGLIGNNGAGKSTLIRCLAGLYPPEKGSVQIDGEESYDNVKVKQMIAYQPDVPEFIGFRFLKQQVREYAICYDDFDEQKFWEFNKTFNLKTKTSIDGFSKGQKCLLALMLNFSRKSRYLILDEPETGLDPQNQEQFHDIFLSEMEQNEMGVLISTHNMATIEKLCDCVAIMHDGRIIYHGIIDDFLECFQKWNVVWPDEETMLNSEFTSIEEPWGKISFVVTCGDARANENELLKKGAVTVEKMQITLEEAYRYYSPNSDRLAGIIEKLTGGEEK